MPSQREVDLNIETEGARVTAMRMIKSLWNNHTNKCVKPNCDVKLTIEQLGDIISWKLIDKPTEQSAEKK